MAWIAEDRVTRRQLAAVKPGEMRGAAAHATEPPA
jgi:hypothetical protein